jgi:hypothetical protein
MVAWGTILFWAPSAFGQATSSPPSAAQGPEIGAEQEARVAFEDGVRLLRTERWTEAEVRFRRSIALAPRPSASYDLAFVLYRSGRARESSRLLRGLLDAPQGAFEPKYREYARALLPHVMAELSTILVIVDPPNAEVRIDGEIAPPSGAERSVAVDAGAHRVEALAPGFAAQTFEISTQASAEVERAITLRPVNSPVSTSLRPPLTGPAGAPGRPERVAASASLERDGAPPSTFSTSVAPWLTAGLGSMLLAGGAVTAIMAASANSNVMAKCPTLQGCDASLSSTREGAVHLGAIADVLLVSGAVVFVGGVSWRLLTPEAPERSRQPNPRAWVLWATTGVLAAGAATAGVLSLIAAKDYATQLDAFPGDAAGTDRARSRARTLGLVTDALAGMTGVAGGLGLYVTLSGRERTAPGPNVEAGVALPGIQLRGSY